MSSVVPCATLAIISSVAGSVASKVRPLELGVQIPSMNRWTVGTYMSPSFFWALPSNALRRRFRVGVGEILGWLGVGQLE